MRGKGRRPFEIVPDLAKSIPFFVWQYVQQKLGPHNLHFFVDSKNPIVDFLLKILEDVVLTFDKIPEYIEVESFMSWPYFPPF